MGKRQKRHHRAKSEVEQRNAQWRRYIDRASEVKNDWQGIPVLLDDPKVVVHDRHPMREFFEQQRGLDVKVMVGGPSDVPADERIINHWYCPQRNADVVIMEGGGRRYHVLLRRAPDRSMDRLDLWLTTLGAADGWDTAAEAKARRKLRGMLTDRQWRHYDLTGSFLETSPRSRLTYLFRRLRPTVVMTPRNRRGDDVMRVLAVLCLHPIGYYERSWGGCMVPTDDVIAHLTMMRGTEAYYWSKANAHESAAPEAGL